MKKHKYVTDYVCCTRCYRKGMKPKPEIESKWAFKPPKNFFQDFINGVIFRIPLCCNLYFSWLRFTGHEYIAYIVSKTRNDGSFGGFIADICEKDRKFIEKGLKKNEL